MTKWRGWLTGGGAVLALAGGVLWLGPSGPASGAETAEIAVQPAAKNVPNDGNTFSVDIKVSDVNNLGAFDFTISFDNDVLEYTGLIDGGYLSSTGRRTVCIRPAAGEGGETREQIANRYGALHYGCTTNGLIENGVGTAGPSGDGLLATLNFKPKDEGIADLEFEGLDSPLLIGPVSAPLDAGYTGLAQVETCASGDCAGINIETTEQNGIIQVCSANNVCPTAVPATPTKVPRTTQPINQATVDAALNSTGTPRAVRTPVPGNTAPAGTTGGTRGGTTSGVRGATTGANGAPVAGYGPQPAEQPSWPRNVGLALVLAGLAACAAGARLRRQES